jgi:hypothetical protein
LSLDDVPFYLWDIAYMFSDVLDYIRQSELVLDKQKQKLTDIIIKKAKENNYTLDEYHSEIDEIRYRFDVRLSRNITYSTIIFFVTSIEWSVIFIRNHLDGSVKNRIQKKPKGMNESIFYLKSLMGFIHYSNSDELEILERIIKIRNCIVHAGGVLDYYKYKKDIEEITNITDGIKISNEGFIEKTIDIDKDLICSIIIHTQSWLIQFIEDCRVKNIFIVK